MWQQRLLNSNAPDIHICGHFHKDSGNRGRKGGRPFHFFYRNSTFSSPFLHTFSGTSISLWTTVCPNPLFNILCALVDKSLDWWICTHTSIKRCFKGLALLPVVFRCPLNWVACYYLHCTRPTSRNRSSVYKSVSVRNITCCPGCES